jgi:pimeloyl-ACP methyl ester carboxylesterase
MNDGTDFASLEDGGRLAFTVSRAIGHAPPVLLHRPLGGSMQLWGEFALRLAARFQVVSFDPRGVGLSTDVPWLYTTREMAGDAAALLTHLGIESTHVFGLSLGGMVASWMAIDSPALVRSLVLASTIPEPSANSSRGLRRALALTPCLALPGTSAEVALVHRILSPQFRAAEPARVLAIERQIREMPAKRRNLVNLGLAAAFHAADLGRASPRLSTLLLFGELDPLAGYKSRTELLRELPNAQLEIIPNAGHDLSLEQPRKTADCLSAFLTRDDLAVRA